MKIKQGDNILIICGKDHGKQGLVEKVLTKESKLIVTGINIAKHSLKPSRKNPHGGIVNIPTPVQISNVMLICPHCGKPMSDAWELDLGDDELEYDCGWCEEPMLIHRNIEITYCTRKVAT